MRGSVPAAQDEQADYHDEDRWKYNVAHQVTTRPMEDGPARPFRPYRLTCRWVKFLQPAVGPGSVELALIGIRHVFSG